jgi:hypothetical protein
VGLPEDDKDLFSHAISTGDPVKINLDLTLRAALGEGIRQTFCPLLHKLPGQDDLNSISEVQDSGSQHKQWKCIPYSVSILAVMYCVNGTYLYSWGIAKGGGCPLNGRLPRGWQ